MYFTGPLQKTLARMCPYRTIVWPQYKCFLLSLSNVLIKWGHYMLVKNGPVNFYLWSICSTNKVQLIFLFSFLFKVEPYSIYGSFLKLEYLKTEFNEDNSTYGIVKVISHSCRIMVNLSISGYFEVMWHPLRTYLDVFRFLAKCQDSPFT